MKKLFLIFTLMLSGLSFLHAQEEDVANRMQDDRLRSGMKLYIHQRLAVTDEEAKKFDPLLEKYLDDLRKAHTDNPDPLVRQQKKAEVRLRYRDEFKPIIGEKRANRVFLEEQGFRRQIRIFLQNRREEGSRPRGQGRSLKRLQE